MLALRESFWPTLLQNVPVLPGAVPVLELERQRLLELLCRAYVADAVIPATHTSVGEALAKLEAAAAPTEAMLPHPSLPWALQAELTRAFLDVAAAPWVAARPVTLAEASWLALATLRVLQVARIRPPQASGLAISSVTMLHYHAPMMKKWKLNEATKKHHGSQLQRLNASMHAQRGRGTLEVHVAELVADLPPATPWRVRRAQHELRLAKARIEPLDLLAVLPRSNHRRLLNYAVEDGRNLTTADLVVSCPQGSSSVSAVDPLVSCLRELAPHRCKGCGGHLQVVEHSMSRSDEAVEYLFVCSTCEHTA
jgi:hypothetical protein